MTMLTRCLLTLALLLATPVWGEDAVVIPNNKCFSCTHAEVCEEGACTVSQELLHERVRRPQPSMNKKGTCLVWTPGYTNVVNGVTLCLRAVKCEDSTQTVPCEQVEKYLANHRACSSTHLLSLLQQQQEFVKNSFRPWIKIDMDKHTIKTESEESLRAEGNEKAVEALHRWQHVTEEGQRTLAECQSRDAEGAK